MALLETLQDDFSGSSIDTTVKWTVTNSSSTQTVAGGLLTQQTNGMATGANARLSAKTTYQLTDSYLIVKAAAQWTTTAPQLSVSLYNPSASTHYVRIQVNGTVLRGLQNVGGTVSTLTLAATYSPTAHAYLRLRAVGQTVFAGFSSDGTTWTEQALTTAITYGDAVQLHIDTSNNGSTASNSTLIDAVNPTITSWSATVTGDSITDTDTVAGPAIATAATVAPDTTADGEQVGQPVTAAAGTAIPASLSDPDTLSAPDLTYTYTVNPGGTLDPETLDGPTLTGDALPPGLYPGQTGDTETLDPPGVVFLAANAYGKGLYGAGLYGQGQLDETTTTPDPTGRTNYNYGEGVYGEGIYFGLVAPQPQCDNLTYGTGTYGCGIYYGIPVPVPDAKPLFTDTAGQVRPPMHILGIGPWSPVIWWRGAENYGVGAGNLPARPALPLPAATSKGFTLRLNEGSEARAELNLSRGSGLVIDEMDTDLWWRRKEPRTGQIEMVGRFNTAHVNMSTSDTGLSVSLQFVDYFTLLEARMIMRYLHPQWDPSVASQWNTGTPVTEILRFAIPTNMRLDLSELDSNSRLGVTSQQYTLAPGTPISTVMDELCAISKIGWEWWIETPNDINAAPKLRFQLGTRGLDKGVVLYDLGKGPSNISSWTRQAAADNYVNSLFFTTDEGGLVKTIPAQIAQYGQRDGTAASSTTTGGLKQVTDALAQRKLNKLADRRPTYTIQLAPGFWRGRTHIDVGDTVTLVLRLGKETLTDKYRVTEINVDIDDVGSEQVTLTLGRPLPSPDPRSKRAPLQRLVRYLATYQAPPGSKPIVIDE